MHALPDSPVSIHLPFLKSKFPDIAVLARRGYTLDEIGETLARRSRQASPKVRSAGFTREKSNDTPENDWTGVKEQMRGILEDPGEESSEIHRLLRVGSSAAALRILSTLSLRISGNLGISVSRTTPLVATALHSIAEHGLHGWVGEATV